MPECLELLEKLIAFPTVSDQPLVEMASMLAEKAEDVGFKTHVFETEPGKVNVVSHRGPMDKSGLALCGHMDVVPITGQESFAA